MCLHFRKREGERARERERGDLSTMPPVYSPRWSLRECGLISSRAINGVWERVTVAEFKGHCEMGDPSQTIVKETLFLTWKKKTQIVWRDAGIEEFWKLASSRSAVRKGESLLPRAQSLVALNFLCHSKCRCLNYAEVNIQALASPPTVPARSPARPPKKEKQAGVLVKGVHI
ncbi:hypothetical protein JZ751_023709 [Albula glossodonta]|uniref:Uncharacterized protein n=1 Tax=Albula glossodonta TaxID=121402 RepID=A0A8T2MYR0_9TELE|nr:hypothetical protein JZ751_023709 [Albula glossodonta]